MDQKKKFTGKEWIRTMICQRSHGVDGRDQIHLIAFEQSFLNKKWWDMAHYEDTTCSDVAYSTSCVEWWGCRDQFHKLVESSQLEWSLRIALIPTWFETKLVVGIIRVKFDTIQGWSSCLKRHGPWNPGMNRNRNSWVAN